MQRINQIIAFSVIAVLLSSCGSLSISNKRYSRGLNISWFNAKEDPQQAKASKVNKRKPATVQTSLADQMESPAEETVQADEMIESVVSENPVSETVQEQEQNNDEPVLKKSKTGFLKKAQTVNKLNKMKKKVADKLNIGTSENSANEVSDNLLLLIILALFISPLSVFLFLGEASTPFWINLILYLIFGGVFLFGGYLWGAGIPFIHALLILLEVI